MQNKNDFSPFVPVDNMRNMSSLLQQELNNIFMGYVSRYNDMINREYGINIGELEALWVKVSNGDGEEPKMTDNVPETPRPSTRTSAPGAPKKDLESRQPSSPEPSSAEPTSSEPSSPESSSEKSAPGAPKKVHGSCPYIFSKGAKEGQKCGGKPRKGCEYCSRHKKYEGQVQKIKEKLPPKNKSVVEPKKQQTVPGIVLHKGPEGKLLHRQSGLVFNKEKIVVGKILKAMDNPDEDVNVDTVQQLTTDDVDTIKKYMFNYDKTLVVNPDEYQGESKSESKSESLDEPVRKATRPLETSGAEQLQDSLSDAILQTNVNAEDVQDILQELQVNQSVDELSEEDVEDEDGYESLEEELLDEESEDEE